MKYPDTPCSLGGNHDEPHQLLVLGPGQQGQCVIFLQDFFQYGIKKGHSFMALF